MARGRAVRLGAHRGLGAVNGIRLSLCDPALASGAAPRHEPSGSSFRHLLGDPGLDRARHRVSHDQQAGSSRGVARGYRRSGDRGCGRCRADPQAGSGDRRRPSGRRRPGLMNASVSGRPPDPGRSCDILNGMAYHVSADEFEPSPPRRSRASRRSSARRWTRTTSSSRSSRTRPRMIGAGESTSVCSDISRADRVDVQRDRVSETDRAAPASHRTLGSDSRGARRPGARHRAPRGGSLLRDESQRHRPDSTAPLRSADDR